MSSVSSSGPLQEFLEGQPLFNNRATATGKSRSRIVMAQYLAEIQTLQIEYADGAAWLYSPISMATATAYFHAGSKGTWLWDNVKRRGTVHGHQVNAKQLR